MNNQQKSKMWFDESGQSIPANRITRSEKLRERHAAKLAATAADLNSRLSAFKSLINDFSKEVYESFLEENNISSEARKGNFTWYNFDRSIKVEMSINEQIAFDDMLIHAAKEKFDQFLTDNTSSVEEMIRGLLMHAFETSKGRLDTKRVMNLLQYRQRVDAKKYPLFHEALDLVQKAIRKPKSRTYFRVWVRDDSGEYQNIDLNFSSVEPQANVTESRKVSTADRF
jgi:hypothetical protein